MDLGTGVRAAMRRKQASRALMGTVAAIDPVNLSIDLDIGAGDLITGVRWIEPYAPVVGHLVVALRVGSGWWVLGKNSKDLTGPGYTEETVTILPTQWIVGATGTSPIRWTWEHGDPTEEYVSQGRETPWTYASFAVYPPLDVPTGATVVSAKLSMQRGYMVGPQLVTPVIWQHARTSTAPPPDGTSPASIFAAGPWRPGRLAKGERGSWDLPSNWLSAWVAGTTRGFGIWSDLVAEDASFLYSSGAITLTYTLPA